MFWVPRVCRPCPGISHVFREHCVLCGRGAPLLPALSVDRLTQAFASPETRAGTGVAESSLAPQGSFWPCPLSSPPTPLLRARSCREHDTASGCCTHATVDAGLPGGARQQFAAAPSQTHSPVRVGHALGRVLSALPWVLLPLCFHVGFSLHDAVSSAIFAVCEGSWFFHVNLAGFFCCLN